MTWKQFKELVNNREADDEATVYIVIGSEDRKRIVAQGQNNIELINPTPVPGYDKVIFVTSNFP